MNTIQILNPSSQQTMASQSLNPEKCWKAVQDRDRSHDGEFLFAVSTTGVYCRPSCPARRPHREHVQFFRRPEQAEKAGFRPCLRCRPKSAGDRSGTQIQAICRYIEQHLDDPITLPDLGSQFGISPFHLQRTFKRVLGVSPKAYADSCRMRLLKQRLQAGQNVTRALYDAGYGSSSRLYERTASQLGMTPDRYRRGAIATEIHYACAASPLGRMLVAATERGICAISFAATDDELAEGLKREFPFAVRKHDPDFMRPWVHALRSQLAGHPLSEKLPLDIQATAFQRRVWTYLQSLPLGETKSYGQVARAIGEPTAARAVARACATNPVAVAIPCHRVVRGDGDLGGYRWGIDRKRTLLDLEQKQAGS